LALVKTRDAGQHLLGCQRAGWGGARLVFVNVPELKTVKNRVYLDLVPDGSQSGKLTRIESLGGRFIDDRRRATPGVLVVIADSERNEFDLEGSE